MRLLTKFVARPKKWSLASSKASSLAKGQSYPIFVLLLLTQLKIHEAKCFMSKLSFYLSFKITSKQYNCLVVCSECGVQSSMLYKKWSNIVEKACSGNWDVDRETIDANSFWIPKLQCCCEELGVPWAYQDLIPLHKKTRCKQEGEVGLLAINGLCKTLLSKLGTQTCDRLLQKIQAGEC